MIKVYYRLSNQQAGMPKKKLKNASKEACLINCINHFGLENVKVIFAVDENAAPSTP